MATFSWSDFIQATCGSCLPCLNLKHPTPDPNIPTPNPNPNDPTANRIRRARADELEGLLADVPDTDTEAETLSLHSNPAHRDRPHRRKKRPNANKRITIFGFDLFGRPPGPIHLPDDDDDEHEDLPRTRRRPRAPGLTSTVSSATFDSDAAPLDPAAIDGLTPAQLEEQARAAAAEEQRLREERRVRRKERKELKRVARALAAGVGVVGDGEEGFEGFQGSGQAYPHIPAMFHGAGHVGEDEGVRGVGGEEEDADADLDGGLYARRSNAASNSGGSGSRSRTSASRSHSQVSDPAVYEYSHNHHYISQAQTPSSQPQEEVPPKKKKKKSSSKQLESRSSTTTTTTSSTASLRSPVNNPTALGTMSPGVVSVGEGGMLDAYGFPSSGFGGVKGVSRDGALPSPGFSGGGGGRRGKGDMGAFLATRGDA